MKCNMQPGGNQEVMKIYDISQEVFGCEVYPGDPAPKREVVLQIDRGDVCNLTALSMCAHNGTHIDAPYHFINSGKKVGELALEACIGKAYVAEGSGELKAREASTILDRAKESGADAARRILLKGSLTVSLEAAEIFAQGNLLLLGNESQTFGSAEDSVRVHQVLLGAGVVLLEGIRLEAVPEGVYNLCAAPLNLGVADGAPCRAVLIEE